MMFYYFIATFRYFIYFKSLCSGLDETEIFNKSAFANKKLFSPESFNTNNNINLIGNNNVFITT